MNNYKLVFDGTLSEGHQVEDVKKNLASLLEANEKQIELLFSRPEVIIKKNMDYESAVRYQKTLQKAGTVCKVMEAAQNQVAAPVEKAAPVNTNSQFVDQPVPAGTPDPFSDHAASPQTQQIADESVMKIGETNSTQALHNPASQLEEAREPAEKKIGRGIGNIVSGIVIIGIGLFWGGSIFLGNADALDVFFDCLGIFWIVKGFYKMIS